MKPSIRFRHLFAIGMVAAAAVPATASAALTSSQKKAIEKVGANAYTYGYAPVYMDHNVARFPQNMVINVQYLATDLTRSIVKPNADSLYTLMVLDVKDDPVIVHTPDTGSRYFGLEILDSYTNVFGYIGTRTTGTTAGDYAIVGPNWNANSTPLNRSVKSIIHSATPRVWIIGRTLVDNQADVSAAVAIQNGISAQYNSKVGAGQFMMNYNLNKPGDTAATPTALAPTADFFKEFGKVTAAQPPLTADASLVTSLAKYGVGPGLDPNKTQTSAVIAELVKGAKSAEATITSKLNSTVTTSKKKHNGWILFDGVGNYGTDYLTRAVIAKFGLGANRPEEAIYPAALTDYSGKALTGASNHVYKIHFNKDQTPPVDAFWSVTLYAEDQFFVANPLSRFAIGDRTPGMLKNSDGSLDIWISAAQPSAARGGIKNWLPAPAGSFNLMLRAYMPKSSVLNNTWVYPKITKVS